MQLQTPCGSKSTMYNSRTGESVRNNGFVMCMKRFIQGTIEVWSASMDCLLDVDSISDGQS